MRKETSDAIKKKITFEITGYIEKYMNKPGISTKWGKPLVGFADAASPYILALKEVVGPGHQTPADVLEDASIVIAYTTSPSQRNWPKQTQSTAGWLLWNGHWPTKRQTLCLSISMPTL